MNDKQRESLSAFFDGELTDPEAIESLVKQSGCSKTFGAMCQQRDALHGQINDCLPVGFADQVARAIADEPTVLCPAAARTSTVEAPQQSNFVQGWFGGRSSSFAIAASVAALGFVGLVMLSEGDRSTGSELVANSAPVSSVTNAADPFVAVAPKLSVRQEAVRPVTSDVRSIDFNSLSPQLRAQLLQHMEASSGNRVQTPNISTPAGN